MWVAAIFPILSEIKESWGIFFLLEDTDLLQSSENSSFFPTTTPQFLYLHLVYFSCNPAKHQKLGGGVIPEVAKNEAIWLPAVEKIITTLG